ncbi:MAG TPA: hypothetical protein PLP21_01600 [Pyrinomonadaceae bacterium]|nr:hypothetical protein [Pyrinomonadaceae bacterium]
MKKFILIAVVFLALSSITVAQTPKLETSKDLPNGIQLTPFGYIFLAKEYWAFMEVDYMDAWSGFIEPVFGKGLRIRFSDGLIVSVFDGHEKVEKIETKIGQNTITYLLVNNANGKQILAKVGSANFSAKIVTDDDKLEFLKIIAEFRRGRCETCLNSRNTKQMRAVFEKRASEQPKEK